MKNYNTAVICIVAAFLVSCGGNVRISGVVSGAPHDTLAVKLLDINSWSVPDTIETDASGRFAYRMDIAKGQPEFVYLFRGETKIASLLLHKGDRVRVEADTSGNYSVEGSEESVRLQEVERSFSAFLSEMRRTYARSEGASEAELEEINRELSRQYTDYYRKAVKYVASNPYSLTVVPVFFQKVNDGFPVFSRPTDALQFRVICDSLKTVYPDSKYVKSLEKEAARRLDAMKLSDRIASAESASFPDLELPSINGRKVKLSEVDAKVILVHFWAPSQTGQVLFNTESLKPLYDEYHKSGFEIYSVAVDTDKAAWATIVKNQGLEWINVCDGLGTMSPSLTLYNVGGLPVSFLISDGEMVTLDVADDASLRKFIAGKLKRR
ncbi:MAG: AhpC/TSA family protein [Bacteroidales bacterium]|nr:AhpC/TSA family protein [Bacteroidales bacterium]